MMRFKVRTERDMGSILIQTKVRNIFQACVIILLVIRYLEPKFSFIALGRIRDFSMSLIMGYFVHLVRRNLEAQVVSLAALMLTGRPLNNEARIGPTLKKPLDEKKLRFLCEFVVNSDANWRRFLRGQRGAYIIYRRSYKGPSKVRAESFRIHRSG